MKELFSLKILKKKSHNICSNIFHVIIYHVKKDQSHVLTKDGAQATLAKVVVNSDAGGPGQAQVAGEAAISCRHSAEWSKMKSQTKY